MLNHYYTIKEAGSHEITIQKSRFIGHIERVNSVQEAQQFIHRIKKEHYNATHNCSAYLIGDFNDIQKANDDGEPSGTAGMPMLDALQKLELKNTVAVVTRYFGGIKLGAGGLIRAYSSATSETIKHTGIVQRTLMQGFLISIPYPLLGKIQHHLETSPHIIDNIDYLEHVNLSVYTKAGEEDTFINEIINLSNDQATIKEIGKKYIETNVNLD